MGRLPKYSLSRSRLSASSSSGAPVTRATVSLVRSSSVGPQTAGGDDQIAARERLAQHGFQTPGIVAHHMNVQQIHAQGRKFARHMGRVGIDGMAEQKLGAHGDDFRLHMTSLASG